MGKEEVDNFIRKMAEAGKFSKKETKTVAEYKKENNIHDVEEAEEQNSSGKFSFLNIFKKKGPIQIEAKAQIPKQEITLKESDMENFVKIMTDWGVEVSNLILNRKKQLSAKLKEEAEIS